MNKTVFVVEKGCYSDYHVVGIYEKLENAERIAKLVSDIDDLATVVEWTLNPMIEELNIGMEPYYISISEGGLVKQLYKESWDTTYDLSLRFFSDDNTIGGVVWAKDEQGAIKIANDFRIQMIAEGELRNPIEAERSKA